MSEERLIYIVTTMYLKTEEDQLNIVRTRMPGFFYEESEAEQCIKENWGDIYEMSYYNYALIEVMGPGLYNTRDKIRWFSVEANGDGYEVKEIDKPKQYENVLCFGMG